MFLHLTNGNGDILYSSIPETCQACFRQGKRSIGTTICPGTKARRRYASTRTKEGTVYFCGDDKALLRSRRIVRERLRLYSDMLQELEHLRKGVAQNVSQHMRRLMHNLISQNAHNIQEIYDIVPQESLGRRMSEQIDSVQEALKEDPLKAAKAFLRMNKHNVAMKCEFSAFKFLYDGGESAMKIRQHKVHKVVLNALHLFFQDFRDKGVWIEVEQFEGSVAIDYESIQVALYHLIDNAVKYVLNNTRVNVTFPIVDGKQRIRFDMVSMLISDTDILRLFDEGYSGQLPRTLRLAGHGLGLAIARDLLKLNGADLEVRRNVDPALRQTMMLAEYENNQFDVVLGIPLGVN